MATTQNAVSNQEYRNVPITVLVESASNPRKRFNERSIEELVADFKTQSVSRPFCCGNWSKANTRLSEARRLRAARLAELASVPVRIAKLTDAEAIAAQVVELSVVGKISLCVVTQHGVPSLPQRRSTGGIPTSV